MNCTKDEFLKQIGAAFPNKFTSQEITPGAWRSYEETIYVLDTFGECSLPYATQASLASHVWKDGTVIKDSTGLFAQPVFTSGPFTYTLPVTSPPGLTYSFKIGGLGGSDLGYDFVKKEEKKAKCICGAHSVNSNQHSDWCDLKENLCGV